MSMPVKTNFKSSASKEKKIATIVSSYQRDFPRDSVICSIIQAWAITNSIREVELGKSQRISKKLSLSPAGDMANDLSAAVGMLSLKDVEVAFENLIDFYRKKTEGAVYTPNYITDYLINRCANQRATSTPPRFLDPACGGGGFIIRAIPIISKLYNIDYETVIEKYVYGIDINEESIECAELSLDLFCTENNIFNRDPKGIFKKADTLTTPPSEILNALGVDDGFDIIATNPPYVKLQNLEDQYRIELALAFPEHATGSFSLAMLFLIAGHRLLSNTGALGYITQNNIFTSLAGIGVRDYLQRMKCLNAIVDFEHYKVFYNASAYTCLIFLDNRHRDKFRYLGCNNPKSRLPEIKETDFYSLPLAGLRKEKWRLTAPHHLKNLRTLEGVGTPLGQIAEIRVGFATLKDSVFLLSRQGGDYGIEEGICAPAIKISEMNSEADILANTRCIIRPYRKVGKRWIPISENEIKKIYPNAYAYLRHNYHQLNERDKGKCKMDNFYEWGRSQCIEAPGPKLLTKTFSKGPMFMLDESDSLFCNGYSVRPRSEDGLFDQDIDIKLLQKILNSWVMDYYARLTSFQIDGGYQCFQKNFIEKFSIPNISNQDAAEIERLSGDECEVKICDVFGLEASSVLGVCRG